jgi:4-carboxymuconolactone decarboxylase
VTDPGIGKRRLPLRSSTDTEGEVQRVLGKLEGRGSDLTVVRMIANSPNAFRPFVLFSDALMTRSPVAADIREVVILHLAVRMRQSYEWFEHEAMSERAGVTNEQRQAIRDGRLEQSLFSDNQLLAVTAADEMLDGRRITDVTWQEMVDTFGPGGALDIVLTIGWWGGLVPLVLDALQLQDPRTNGPSTGRSVV